MADEMVPARKRARSESPDAMNLFDELESPSQPSLSTLDFIGESPDSSADSALGGWTSVMNSLRSASKNCKSWCWEHYRRYEHKGDNYAVCMHCFESHQKLVKSGTTIPQNCMIHFGSDGSTTNLISHLRYRHPEIHRKQLKLNAAEEKAIPSESTNGESILKHVIPAVQFSSALKRWIVDDLQPLRTVESQSFKKMIHSINPKVIIPCRATITRGQNSIYFNCN